MVACLAAIAFPTKISDRVALAQNQTLERLASEGVISESVAIQISQTINLE